MCSRAKKRGVPFIHVVDRGLQADRLQGAVAADPQQDLLPDSHLAVSAVQLVGDAAVFRSRVVGECWYPAGTEGTRPTCTLQTCACTGCPARSTSTITGLPSGPMSHADRQIVKIVVHVRFLLPAGLAEILAEVSLLVEQSDAHQWHAQVAGRLQMIAGQNAETAGENREALGQSELG